MKYSVYSGKNMIGLSGGNISLDRYADLWGLKG